MILVQLDSEQITIDNTVGGVGFTGSKITSKVIKAVCGVSGADIRFDCVNAPTAAVGLQMVDDSIFEVTGYPDLVGFRAIRTAAVDAKLDVLYYGSGD